jgi:hypothetical protein
MDPYHHDWDSLETELTRTSKMSEVFGSTKGFAEV